ARLSRLCGSVSRNEYKVSRFEPHNNRLTNFAGVLRPGRRDRRLALEAAQQVLTIDAQTGVGTQLPDQLCGLGIVGHTLSRDVQMRLSHAERRLPLLVLRVEVRSTLHEEPDDSIRSEICRGMKGGLPGVIRG